MEKIQLDNVSTRAPKKMDKEETKKTTANLLTELDELQNLLYAEAQHSVLVIVQGMDASGKDGVIRNVFGNLNPQGVQVQSFKIPSAEELAHDFLWRIHKHAPPKGIIQIFNRSHYEDVLITRVHKLIDDETAYRRMNAINNFENLLFEDGSTQVLKFYLHVSAEEQQERLQERLNDPRKQWKYNESDFREAALRKDYLEAYNDCINRCNSIPWVIVPADQNWYKEYLIIQTLHETLTGLKMRYPGIKK